MGPPPGTVLRVVRSLQRDEAIALSASSEGLGEVAQGE